MQIDHEITVRTNGLADRPSAFHDPDDAADLDRLDAALHQRSGLVGRPRVRVNGNGLAYASAEQVPDGSTEGLAFDVPERHVDRRQGAAANDPGLTVTHHRNVHLLPETLDVERVLS